MNVKQYTFTEFSRKTVISVSDGKELGHVCDLVFNSCGAIGAIIVPGKKSLFKSLTSAENLYIPFNRVVKIGADVILTDVVGMPVNACAQPEADKGYGADYAGGDKAPQYFANAYSAPQADGQYPPKNAGYTPSQNAGYTPSQNGSYSPSQNAGYTPSQNGGDPQDPKTFYHGG